jgi:hypothetical protein
MIILGQSLKELPNMRVQVVPSFFLSSKQDHVHRWVGQGTDCVGQDMIQELSAIGVVMTGCVIDGGGSDWFEQDGLLIPFGSNGERE